MPDLEAEEKSKQHKVLLQNLPAASEVILRLIMWLCIPKLDINHIARKNGLHMSD